jgi:hypothetical protein
VVDALSTNVTLKFPMTSGEYWKDAGTLIPVEGHRWRPFINALLAYPITCRELGYELMPHLCSSCLA